MREGSGQRGKSTMPPEYGGGQQTHAHLLLWVWRSGDGKDDNNNNNDNTSHQPWTGNSYYHMI